MLSRTLLALLAGVLLSTGFEPVAIGWVIPVAVAGLVLTTRGCRARSGWVPGLAFGLGFYLVHTLWMMHSVGTGAWLGMGIGEALFYGVLGSLSAVLQTRRGWPLWVAAAWTVTDLWRATWPFSGMPWGRLAFGVVDTPAARALPYAGMTGVSLAMALLGCLLAWLVLARGTQRLVAGGVLVALLAAFAVPALRPWQFRESGTATVAAVQGNVPGDGDEILPYFREVTQNHVDATVDLARRVDAGTVPQPDFVVWPENSTAVDPFTDTQTNDGIETAVRAIGVPLLVGAIVDAGASHVLNQGIVWDPVTGAGDRYTKRHPVVFGEYIPFRRYLDGLQIGQLSMVGRDMLSGTREEPLSIAGVEVAAAICFDVAYDDGFHDQIRNGAQMITLQTSNVTFINTNQIDQQFAITRLRAEETGRWAVVAAPNGISGVIAADGRVVASTAPRTRAVLLEQVGLSSQLTPAVRLGAWPGRLAVALTALGLLVGWVPYRRSKQASVEEPARVEGAGPARTRERV